MRFVYFMRRADGTGLIKIGCATNPNVRRAEIGQSRGAKLAILAAAPGGFAEERALHRHFAAHRVEGEWFTFAPAIGAVIAHIWATGELPILDESEATDPSASSYRQTRGWQHRKLSAEEIEAVNQYKNGASQPELMARYNIEYTRFRRILLKLGVPHRKMKGWNLRDDDAEMTARVAELYRGGEAIAVIMSELNLASAPLLYRYLAKAGIKPGRLARVRHRETDAAEGNSPVLAYPKRVSPTQSAAA